MKALTPHFLRLLLLSVCAALTFPALIAASGCSKPIDPKTQSGYYDGPMTPAGGGGPKKGGKSGGSE